MYSNWAPNTNPAVYVAPIADGPSYVVRWTFIYFTTSWIDSEHLQSAGPAPAKLMCVYTLGRLKREACNWRNEAKGPDANHKHFSCLAKSPVEEGFKNPKTNPSLLHTIPITQTLSHYWKYFSIFFGKRGTGLTVAALQLWLDIAPLSSFQP